MKANAVSVLVLSTLMLLRLGALHGAGMGTPPFLKSGDSIPISCRSEAATF